MDEAKQNILDRTSVWNARIFITGKLNQVSYESGKVTDGLEARFVAQRVALYPKLILQRPRDKNIAI